MEPWAGIGLGRGARWQKVFGSFFKKNAFFHHLPETLPNETQPSSNKLAQKFHALGCGEGGVVGAGQGEGAWAADDFAGESGDEVGFVVQDAEAVDGDAGGDEAVADGDRVLAVVGAAVCGDVDDHASHGRGEVCEEMFGGGEGVPYGSEARPKDAWHVFDQGCEGGEVGCGGDGCPGDDDVLLGFARKKEDGEEGAAGSEAGDDVGVAQGGGHAAGDEAEFLEADAGGAVCGEDKGQAGLSGGHAVAGMLYSA